MGLKNLKSRKLYLQVYEQLKEYILQNQLKPGDKLPTEMEMSALLGVSRNVLREAIKSLEIAGIVSSKPGVGIIIQEFSTDFLFQSLIYHLAWNSETLLHQTLAVRRTLELGFVEAAFESLGVGEMTLLEQQVDIMRISFDIQNKLGSSATVFGSQFYEADAAFHNILYSKAENKILSSVIDAVWSCDKYYKKRVAPTYINFTVTKHENIVTALRNHSLEDFRAAMHYHFDTQYKAPFLSEEGESGETTNSVPRTN